MAKRKTDDAQLPDGVTETAPPLVAQPAPDAGAAQEPQGEKRSQWVARFGSWGDYEAGVHLAEDRENRRMTIKFDEKPSEAVRTLMKSKEHGFRFDEEDVLWYKFINPAKPRQVRQEAEDLVFQVANIIRQEKGLPEKKDFSLAV